MFNLGQIFQILTSKLLKGTFTPIKESLLIEGYNIAITLVVIFFRRGSTVEKNEFQNRVFLFSNFLGAALLDNCHVS